MKTLPATCHRCAAARSPPVLGLRWSSSTSNKNHMGKITFAVHNLIRDLGGMLSDGAKAGCALKVASSADSAIRSAYMALNNHGITEAEGFVGKAPEETIRNLSKISAIGMAKVNDTMLAIMKKRHLEGKNGASTHRCAVPTVRPG